MKHARWNADPDSGRYDLQVHAQIGVEHVCSNPPGSFRDWGVDVLSRYRQKVESYGISLDMFELPVPAYHETQANITGGDVDVPWNVYDLGSPERDREIEQLWEVIRNAYRVGIPAVKYNFSLIVGLRTQSARGRGGAVLSTFRYDQLDQSLPPIADPPLDPDDVWDRLEYLVMRLMPVADEYKVRRLPPRGSLHWRFHLPRSAARAGHSRRPEAACVDVRQSYHGINFCPGTVSEMLQRPGEEIYDVIR